jgi:hypothetical protein
VNPTALDAALRPVSDGLRSDGYEVEVSVVDDVISVRVTAGPDACADCLVPKPLMTDIVVQALGDVGLQVPSERVRLTYPGDA